jgi:hypothetical protein
MQYWVLAGHDVIDRLSGIMAIWTTLILFIIAGGW